MRHDRLVVHLERAVARARRRSWLTIAMCLAHPRPHRPVEELEAALRRRLGAVHGGVGVRAGAPRRRRRPRRRRCRCSRSGAPSPRLGRERLGERGSGSARRARPPRASRRRPRAGARTRRRPAGRRCRLARIAARSRWPAVDQQLVAGHVAEAVVHELEVVEIEQHDDDVVALAPRPGERLAPAGRRRSSPVGQARERIVDGLMVEPALELVPLGRVARRSPRSARCGRESTKRAGPRPRRTRGGRPCRSARVGRSRARSRPASPAIRRADALGVLGGDQVEDAHRGELVAAVSGHDARRRS